MVVVQAPAARTEEEIATDVAAVGRRGPIVAVAANMDETATAVVAITGGGEEQGGASDTIGNDIVIPRCALVGVVP